MFLLHQALGICKPWLPLQQEYVISEHHHQLTNAKQTHMLCTTLEIVQL
jgi:hypothetical protein